MAFFKLRKSGDEPSGAPTPAETVESMRLRATFRLIGAAVLVLAAVIGFPLVFDSQPRPIAVDVAIEIPEKSRIAPLTVSKALSPDTVHAGASSPVIEEKAPEMGRNAPSSKSEPVPEVKLEAKGEDKPEIKAQAKADVKLETKAEPKVAAKPDDSAKVLALLEGKTAGKAENSRIVVQVGAFAEVSRAKEARGKLEAAGMKTYTQVIETKEGQRTRVRVGPFEDRAEADKAAEKIRALGLNVSILNL